jgi:hypothetical protein
MRDPNTGAYVYCSARKPLVDAGRQNRPTILVALAALDEELVTVEVQVLHPELQAFQQPHSGSVEKRHDDPVSLQRRPPGFHPEPHDRATLDAGL